MTLPAVDIDSLTPENINTLNSFAGYLSYKPTWIYRQFMRCPARTILWTTGNRFGKTRSVAQQYVARFLGRHPVEKKNGLRRVWRFCSATLPTEKDASGEVRNTQYPAFKEALPHEFIEKDITHRRPVMVLRDPFGGNSPESKTKIEFLSYAQEVQATAGVERDSIWEDEEPPHEFHQEQLARLVTSDGDLIITCTPANIITWLHDEIYDKARFYVRTPAVAEQLGVQRVTKTNSPHDIAVFMAATDDNPIIEPHVIDELFGMIDDPDLLAIRRFGIFKQVSGRIFKDFSPEHVIKPFDIPHEWTHARLIDYHTAIPWAILWVSLSPENEMFVWQEWAPHPHKFVTEQIVDGIISRSGTYDYPFNRIDPLAASIQPNTGISTIQDLNRLFYDKEERCYWKSWDTKSNRGQEELRKRLKNSLEVGKPFQNDGLPTVWFSNECRETIQSMRKWRLDEYVDRRSRQTKDQREKPQGKWSHFPMCLEAILKEPGWRPMGRASSVMRQKITARQHYQGRF